MNGPRYSSLISLALLLGSLGPLDAHARIYSWVDEEGKVHYGDRVPAEYREASSRVKLKDSSIALTKSSASGSKGASSGVRKSRKSGAVRFVSDSDAKKKQQKPSRHYTHTRNKFRLKESQLRRTSDRNSTR